MRRARNKAETGHTIVGAPCAVRVLRISRIFRLLSYLCVEIRDHWQPMV